MRSHKPVVEATDFDNGPEAAIGSGTASRQLREELKHFLGAGANLSSEDYATIDIAKADR